MSMARKNTINIDICQYDTINYLILAKIVSSPGIEPGSRT